MRKIIIAIACLTLCGALHAEELARPKITALAHGGFFTKDFDNTRNLFKDFFGFEEPILMPNKEEGGYRFAFIKVSESQYIEVFPERSPTANRMYHFAIVTEDADAMRLYLKERGCDLPDTTPKGRTGNSNYFVTDPNGTFCEVVEYEPDSMTAETKGQFLPSDRISQRLDHVGFFCPDLDKALSFYVEILGFREVWRSGLTSEGVELVRLQVPEGGECIELIVGHNEPSWEESCSMHHISLSVSDIDAVKALLDSRTLPQGCHGTGQIVVGHDNRRYMDYFNVDGTRIQIVEE